MHHHIVDLCMRILREIVLINHGVRSTVRLSTVAATLAYGGPFIVLVRTGPYWSVLVRTAGVRFTAEDVMSGHSVAYFSKAAAASKAVCKVQLKNVELTSFLTSLRLCS